MEVPWEHLVKGDEHEKKKFVLITDEDFEKVDVKPAQTFVNASADDFFLHEHGLILGEITFQSFNRDEVNRLAAKLRRDSQTIVDKRFPNIANPDVAGFHLPKLFWGESQRRFFHFQVAHYAI